MKQWAAGVQHGRLQKAAGLHLEAFWQHHRSKVLAAGGLAVIYILWFVCSVQFCPCMSGIGAAACYRTQDSGDRLRFAYPVMCRKTMFSVTSIFVNLSETMAELGFLVRHQHGVWRDSKMSSCTSAAIHTANLHSFDLTTAVLIGSHRGIHGAVPTAPLQHQPEGCVSAGHDPPEHTPQRAGGACNNPFICPKP